MRPASTYNPDDIPTEPPSPSNIAALATTLRHLPTGETLAAALLAYLKGEILQAREEAAGQLVGIRQPQLQL